MIRTIVCRECGQTNPVIKDDRCFKSISGAHDWIEAYPPKKTLREQVAEFHAAMNMKDPTTPTVISDDRVRLRAKLIAEEFFEVMEAMFGPIFGQAIEVVEEARTKYPVHINMPELFDGMGDLDYVVEGTRLEFGGNGEPIAAEIHRTNMAKFIGEPVWSEPASPGGARKRLKPAGWTPPDIAGELRKQGWKP
jgi:predicted HAD superfamily Cof-like phosphohydrolase